jgi:2-polyprenyl-3-methyl-5-hydroxy-6-metoxy-1,4-benzoquinol methylase
MFRASDRNFHTTGESFQIALCRTCGVAQTLPRPDERELSRYYPPRYYPTRAPAPAVYERTIGREQKEKLRFLKRFRSGGTLLDIGCGAGYFVREASLAGFDAQGIELSADAASFGRSQWNLRIAEGDIRNAAYKNGSFDVVTLWHVLEHLPDVHAMLAKTCSLLTHSGIVVVAVPNFGSVQARLFRGRWYHLDVPRHLFHYSPSSLSTVLAQHALVVRGIDHRSREHNWAGILGSIVEFSPPGMTLAGAAARKYIGRPLSRLVAGVESFWGGGGTFTLCAEKTG